MRLLFSILIALTVFLCISYVWSIRHDITRGRKFHAKSILVDILKYFKETPIDLCLYNTLIDSK